MARGNVIPTCRECGRKVVRFGLRCPACCSHGGRETYYSDDVAECETCSPAAPFAPREPGE